MSEQALIFGLRLGNSRTSRAPCGGDAHDLQPDFQDYLGTVNFVVDFLALGCALLIFSYALLIATTPWNVTLASIITIPATSNGIPEKSEALWLYS